MFWSSGRRAAEGGGREGSSCSGLRGDGPRRGGGREGSSCSGIRGDGPWRGGGREGSSCSGIRGDGPRRGGGREGSSCSGLRGDGPRRGVGGRVAHVLVFGETGRGEGGWEGGLEAGGGGALVGTGERGSRQLKWRVRDVLHFGRRLCPAPL